MKKILVPCDFSSQSKEAFRFAVQVAERTSGDVYVLKVTELPVIYEPGFGVPEYGFDQALIQELSEDARQKLDELEKACGVSGDNVHLMNESGPINSTIRQVSEDEMMDIIVMGTHHSDGWIESVVGTHTRKIVRSAPVPVFSVKKSVSLGSIRSIVFPTLFATERDDIVEKIIGLQKFFDATLHILYVNSPDDFHRDKDIRKYMNAFVDKYRFERFTTNIYNDESSASGIVNFAREIKADLIAMATHGRKGLTPIFNDSVAEAVLEETDAILWSCVVD